MKVSERFRQRTSDDPRLGTTGLEVHSLIAESSILRHSSPFTCKSKFGDTQGVAMSSILSSIFKHEICFFLSFLGLCIEKDLLPPCKVLELHVHVLSPLRKFG